jgi:hypothetical protein
MQHNCQVKQHAYSSSEPCKCNIWMAEIVWFCTACEDLEAARSILPGCLLIVVSVSKCLYGKTVEPPHLTYWVACALHHKAPVSLAGCAGLAWAAGRIPKVTGGDTAAALECGAAIECSELHHCFLVRR